jgi:hypothetical protein
MRTTHCEKLLQFFDAEDLRPANRFAPDGQRSAQPLQIPLCDVVIKESERVDRLVNRAGCQLPFVGQMKQILPHLLIGQLIWPLPIEFGQLINLINVCFLCSVGQTAQYQFLDELLA